MIPLRDENPSHTTPVVTRIVILVNIAVFLYEIVLGPDLRSFLFSWAFIPLRLTAAVGSGEEALPAPLSTVVTSMFLHGGWMHLIGNMWYLWVFGDNVEDRLGRSRYVIFYLGSGVAAAMMHYLIGPESRVPTVGASGAIAGVLGGYMITYPKARVLTLVPFPFFQIMALPAVIVLGLWFVIQFFSGALELAWATRAGGIAWWAHIGGFVFGVVAMKVLGALASRSRPHHA